MPQCSKCGSAIDDDPESVQLDPLPYLKTNSSTFKDFEFLKNWDADIHIPTDFNFN